MKKILMTFGDSDMTMIYDMVVLDMTMRIELVLTIGMMVNDMTMLDMILTDYMTVTVKKVMSSMITPSLENSSKKYEMTNDIEMTYVAHMVMVTNMVKVVMKQMKMVIQVAMKTYNLWTIMQHVTSVVDVYMSV